MSEDKAERAQRFEMVEKKATRVAVALVIAGPVLAIVAGVLGSAEVFPYEYTMPVALTAMLVPIGLALLIGAVGGLYIMGGWKMAPLGVVFVAGFAGLVFGLVEASAFMRNVGVALLAVSGAVFYLAGVLSQRVPPAALFTWGNAAALVGGTVLVVLGLALDQWAFLLIGAMAAGCAIGGMLGRAILRRRHATVEGPAETEN